MSGKDEVIVDSFAMFNAHYQGKYDLYIPQNKIDKSIPLYVVLPGGLGAKRYEKFRDNFIIPGTDDKRGIIFSPKISWKKANINKLERIIKDFITVAATQYNIDPNNVTLVGYSNGANQAIKIAEENADLFSEIILVASNFKIEQKLETPIHVIHGTEDSFFSIRSAKESVSIAKEAGCDIKLTIAEGKNDFGASQYIPELKAAL